MSHPQTRARPLHDLWLVARSALQPDAPLTISAWADLNRVLDSTSSEPGPWRTSRTPYLAEIMDRLLASDRCERVVFMKGAQIGGSEVANNWIGHTIDQSPGPMLVVQPNDDAAESYSKTRIASMLRGCPRLRELVGDARSRDSGNTVGLKEFPGGFLKLVGANAPTGLASTPIRRLVLDEVDRFPADAGGEGDPVALATQRTASFSNRKLYLCSSPTTKGVSRIEKAYLESDQRQYHVPCPACGAYQVLAWAQVKWPAGKPAEARYECMHCQALLDDHHKTSMLAGGDWRPSADGDGRTAGYHLSSLYSPHGWLSWADLALEFTAAARDPVRLKVFVNTKLGETWDAVDGEQLDDDELMARREQFAAEVPEGGAVLTAGVDIQDDRIEVEVVAWGVGEESWSIEHKVIYGDPSAPTVWKDLDHFLGRTWTHETGAELGLTATCIDTGAHTVAAYAFCKPRSTRRVWAVKGIAGQYPIWPRKPSRNNKGKVDLYIVGVDAAKEAIYGRLKESAPGPGYCHFPLERERGWFAQLTVERLRTRYYHGHPIRFWWKPDNARNEALDCRVYAFAALCGWSAIGYSIGRVLDQLRTAAKLSPPTAAPAAKPKPRGWLRSDRPKGHWF